MKKEIIVKIASPERYYTRCYHDFMDCNLLNGEEKIVFLALKRFLDVKLDNGDVFPTIEAIQKMTGWGNQKVVKYIKSLVKKGVVKKIRQGLSKPNIYIIADYPAIWTCNTVEDIAAVIENKGVKPLTPEEHIAELKKMGYEVEVKKRELASTADQSIDTSTHNKNNLQEQDITTHEESQDAEPFTIDKIRVERYTMNQIQQLFNYDTMIHDNPYQRKDIDSVMDILYTTMNTTKKTIKIAGEDKPTTIVISKLLKLHKDSILYAIEQFSKTRERIKKPAAYMLTILYNAPEQFNLDIQNQVCCSPHFIS